MRFAASRSGRLISKRSSVRLNCCFAKIHDEMKVGWRVLVVVVVVTAVAAMLLWFALRGVSLCETNFSIKVHGPTENLVRFVGSLRKSSVVDKVIVECRSDGAAKNLSEEEIGSSIGSVSVRYDSKSDMTLMFCAKARNKEDSYGIARACLRAAEEALSEQNRNMERCGLAQLWNRVVKLQRKLEKKGRDAEIEKALSNAVDQVRVVETAVAKDRINILSVQFPKDALQ